MCDAPSATDLVKLTASVLAFAHDADDSAAAGGGSGGGGGGGRAAANPAAPSAAAAAAMAAEDAALRHEALECALASLAADGGLQELTPCVRCHLRPSPPTSRV